MVEEGLEHYHCHHALMVEGVGQIGMDQNDVHVRVAEEVEHSYWEGVGLHDHVEVVEADPVHCDDHHEREEVELVSVYQLQVVDWPSQFHHAALQTRR